MAEPAVGRWLDMGDVNEPGRIFDITAVRRRSDGGIEFDYTWVRIGIPGLVGVSHTALYRPSPTNSWQARSLDSHTITEVEFPEAL